MAKSGAGGEVTVKDTVIECERVPATPLMVTV
jgi:hypothetical protein